MNIPLIMTDGGTVLVDTARAEQLVRLLARYQGELFRYIYALVPHVEDARDVLQETSVALCRKFADYDPGQPFLAWAYRFAYLEVLKQRERARRSARLLSRELVERLARERERLDPALELRLAALEECLRALPPGDCELIRRRYEGRTRADELVRQLGASRRTLFRTLDRIRRRLFDCVSRRVAAAAP